jgi:hypothetical protein
LFGSAKIFKVANLADNEDVLNLLAQSAMQISQANVTLITLTSKLMIRTVLGERKCEKDARVVHVLIFVMLDTPQIVKPFNPLWSH